MHLDILRFHFSGGIFCIAPAVGWSTASVVNLPCYLQVYDLREYRPGPVLQRIYANLASAVQAGDRAAAVVRRYESLLRNTSFAGK